jgi:predicted nucleotide-binding protein (sugar kinase/HSP70/actin superfamily)
MGYYYFYPFFRALLLAWGADPVVSPPTTPRVLEGMDSCPTDEPCLAVKLHFSHADALARREDVDFLLLPVLEQVGEITCCPKFIGVSDMIRHGLQLADTQVVMPILTNLTHEATLITALRPLWERLGIRNHRQVRDGIRRAREAQAAFQRLCQSHRLTTPEAYRLLEHETIPAPAPVADGPATAIIGHAYLLYEIVSQGIVDRLRAYGPVTTAEMVDPTAALSENATITDGEKLWPFEGQLLGAALHLLRTRTVERLILVGSFECGPESMIEAYIEEEAHRQGIPFMLLALDEHSGEAGLLTRIESFMDMEAVEDEPLPVLPAVHAVPAGRRVVGMPSMGHLQGVVSHMLNGLGVETLPTPAITPALIELGRELAPEFVCYPFTATLGQMRTLLDQGATTLLMVGGKGYCRLGWYAQVQERLLRTLGYDVEMLVVDAPLPLREKWHPFNTLMKTLTNQAPWPRILGAVYEGMQRLSAIDAAERELHRLRAFERVRGTADRLFQRHLQRLLAADGVGAIRRAERDFTEAIAHIETEETRPLRIRVTGEIWVVLETGATRDVERWLGARDYPRVWVDRELSTTQWFQTHVIYDRTAMRRERQILDAARPWLSRKVGGHGQQTVGATALARQEGMDGVLHVFPFTCMPEIIAQNILVRLAEEQDLPILTYIVSEQTGEAGMETRLESFLDLLEERRHGGQSTALPAFACAEFPALPRDSMN